MDLRVRGGQAPRYGAGGCVLRAGTGVRATVILLSVGCDRQIATGQD